MVAMPHKLLLADDSVTIQRVIELTFADEDVQVTAVGNGQAAIDSVQRDRPDIVLADVGMPERNGYEVAAFIKGNPALAHIPVVLLTGAFEPIDEARARSVGCDGVLVKPFEPQIVINRVKDLLAGRQPSGMWGTGPVAQGPIRQPAAPAPDARPTGQTGRTDPLEAYFDHLDAAFASGTPAGGADLSPPSARRDTIPVSRTPEPTARSASNDPFADWDPDLTGDPSRPASLNTPLVPVPPRPAAAPQVQEAARAPAPASPAAPPPAPAAAAIPVSAPAPHVPPPSLVDAFTALLAAEQRIGLAPSAATTPASSSPSGGAPAAPLVTEAVIETIAARVVARLTDQSRHTILDAAERLVREEIERIKQNSGMS
jgi:CheY-like chemotaxis protein